MFRRLYWRLVMRFGTICLREWTAATVSPRTH
jgi:hypothetical protein